MPLYVNGTEITDEQVFAEMQYHPAQSAEQAQEMAARALAIKELLVQEARKLGITPPDELKDPEIIDDYLISRLMEQEVVTPTPTDEECERYYQNNPKVFRDMEGNPAPFASVKESIAEYLKECIEKKAIQQYIKILAGNASVVGIRLETSDGPLVQ